MRRNGLTVRTAAAALTLALALSPVMTAYAATGWQSENGGWVYYDSDGTKHKGWIQTKDGYYYMDLSDSSMTKGFKKIDSKCTTAWRTGPWSRKTG